VNLVVDVMCGCVSAAFRESSEVSRTNSSLRINQSQYTDEYLSHTVEYSSVELDAAMRTDSVREVYHQSTTNTTDMRVPAYFTTGND